MSNTEIVLHLNQNNQRIIKTLENFYKKNKFNNFKERINLEIGFDLKIDNEIYFCKVQNFKDFVTPLAKKYFKSTIITLSLNKKNGSLHIKEFKKKKNFYKKQTMKIRIKAKNEVDLTKVFPLINDTEYSLIQDQFMHLNRTQFNKMIDKKYLDFSGVQISTDLIETYEEESASEIHEKVQNVVEEKFIYSNDVVDVLMAGIEVGKNVILWGKGGHGKSEITELVLDTLYKEGHLTEEPFVMAFGDGLTEDKLYGGMNIKKFREDGIVEYLPENSFMNHEVVVFEEIFDAPPNVLLGLKDIMTSGRFRQGNEKFNVKTKIYIGLTNKSKDEFAEKDESLKALADRFPLCYKTEWGHYNKVDFVKLFKKVFSDSDYNKYKDKFNQLAEILQYNNNNGTSFVSPRTAVHAAKLFINGRDLKYISEIDEKTLQDYHKQQRESSEKYRQESLIKNIESYIDSQDLDVINSEDEFLKDLQKAQEAMGGKAIDLSELDSSKEDLQVKLNKLNFLSNTLSAVSVLPDLMSKAKSLNKRINETINTVNQEINKKIKNNNEFYSR